MNFSLHHLSLVHYYNSPFLASQKFNINARSVFAQKSFSSFSVGHNLKYILDSHFSQYLSSVIVNRGYSFLVMKEREIYSLNVMYINNTVFQVVSSDEETGGAILSHTDLYIDNCKFIECFANIGGAVFSRSSLNITQSTFFKCKSMKNSGAFEQESQEPSTLTIALSLFDNCNSTYFGTFHRKSPGLTHLETTNITKSTASQCVGCFEVCDGEFEMMRVVFTSSFASVHNGCGVLRDLSSFEADSCAFIKCSHGSFIDTTASVLLFYQIPRYASISSSFFLNNDPSQSHNIFVSGGSTLILNECYFSGDRSKEVSASGASINDEMSEYNCKGKKPSFMNDVIIGFVNSTRAVSFRIPYSSTTLIISVVIAVVLSLFHKRLSAFISKIFKDEELLE